MKKKLLVLLAIVSFAGLSAYAQEPVGITAGTELGFNDFGTTSAKTINTTSVDFYKSFGLVDLELWLATENTLYGASGSSIYAESYLYLNLPLGEEISLVPSVGLQNTLGSNTVTFQPAVTFGTGPFSINVNVPIGFTPDTDATASIRIEPAISIEDLTIKLRAALKIADPVATGFDSLRLTASYAIPEGPGVYAQFILGNFLTTVSPSLVLGTSFSF